MRRPPSRAGRHSRPAPFLLRDRCVPSPEDWAAPLTGSRPFVLRGPCRRSLGNTCFVVYFSSRGVVEVRCPHSCCQGAGSSLLFNLLAGALDLGLTYLGPSYLPHGAAVTPMLTRVLPFPVSEAQFKMS